MPPEELGPLSRQTDGTRSQGHGHMGACEAENAVPLPVVCRGRLGGLAGRARKPRTPLGLNRGRP